MLGFWGGGTRVARRRARCGAADDRPPAAPFVSQVLMVEAHRVDLMGDLRMREEVEVVRVEGGAGGVDGDCSHPIDGKARRREGTVWPRRRADRCEPTAVHWIFGRDAFRADGRVGDPVPRGGGAMKEDYWKTRYTRAGWDTRTQQSTFCREKSLFENHWRVSTK